jgi:hypothetical protein
VSAKVAGAGERFIWGRTKADLGRCGCCTLLLHLLGLFEPAITRLQDTPVLSKQVVYPAISAHGNRSSQPPATLTSSFDRLFSAGSAAPDPMDSTPGWHLLVRVVSLCFAVSYGQIQARTDKFRAS